LYNKKRNQQWFFLKSHNTGGMLYRKEADMEAERQREITEWTDLLDRKGKVASPGYAKRMLFRYNRDRIRARPFALKEWDFYQIAQGDWIIQLTIGHVSYAASISAWIFNTATGERRGFSRLKPLSLRMPLNPEAPHTINAGGRDFSARYEVTGKDRRLIMSARGKKEPVDIEVILRNNPDNEKMVIATPFAGKPGQFYLNYKENYWGAEGHARAGDMDIGFDTSTTALLDWGRGVWPFTQEWFWGSATAFLEGKHFGFNIGWGFGDLSSATENMFFYEDRAYKLGRITVERDTADYLAPWHFSDPDGIFDVLMIPFFDNYSETKLLFVDNRCHQVFGRFSGVVRLPGGKALRFENISAFCEHAKNRW
jgi:hypothetical protein